MPGASDPEYTRAREVLLDALDALRGQLDAVVLVGAQAVYLHTGEADLAVAPTTTDADIALAPDELLAGLPVADAMAAGGFVLTAHVGSWRGRYDVVIDLMVPDALSGAGSRAARIPPHGDRTARKAVGLEAALVDRGRRTVRALEPTDTRAAEIWVAGPAALLVAKLHKISERVDRPDHLSNKDALDVLRLLQATPTEALATSLTMLRADPLAGPTTNVALDLLQELFGTPDTVGSQMAARAVEGLADPDVIAASCAALAEDLLTALGIR